MSVWESGYTGYLHFLLINIFFVLFYAHGFVISSVHAPSKAVAPNRMTDRHHPNTAQQTGRHRKRHNPITLAYPTQTITIPTSVHHVILLRQAGIDGGSSGQLRGIDTEPSDLGEGKSCCTAVAPHRSPRVSYPHHFRSAYRLCLIYTHLTRYIEGIISIHEEDICVSHVAVVR